MRASPGARVLVFQSLGGVVSLFECGSDKIFVPVPLELEISFMMNKGIRLATKSLESQAVEAEGEKKRQVYLSKLLLPVFNRQLPGRKPDAEPLRLYSPFLEDGAPACSTVTRHRLPLYIQNGRGYCFNLEAQKPELVNTLHYAANLRLYPIHRYNA